MASSNNRMCYPIFLHGRRREPIYGGFHRSLKKIKKEARRRRAAAEAR